MKVLLVHKFFHVTGGSEIFFFEAEQVLKRHGHQVACFSTIDPRNKPSQYSSYFVKAPEFHKNNLLKRASQIVKIVYSFDAKKKMRKLLKDFKPDIVHVFTIFSHISPSILDACRQAEVPVVMSCNDYKHICPNQKMFHHQRLCQDCKGGKFYHAVINRCCHDSLAFSMASCLEAYIHHKFNLVRKNVNTFLFANDFMAEKTKEFWGAEDLQWRKLVNPFNSPEYEACYEYGDYCMFFGRFFPEKGVDVLLKAMDQLPDKKLVIVGEGPEKVHLMSLVEKLKLENVEFIGPKWGVQLDIYLKKARFVIVPSIWHENFPYVILQAFSRGKAVIGSCRGGIEELVEDGKYGLTYPAEDYKALAECIRILWNNSDIAVKMGRTAKEFADKEFNDESFYNHLIQIYKDVLK